ncbi:hypothetical protein HNQ07_002681 [Deinococcus metalli]|uniref:Uncharacterized protein n=1 Tax=Deinococcus metalli TaxID=1141878 RepID=A0A7W8NRS4_9DEIO|nr:hypothetical protein [Deinococcus metalli]MBB5377208.1 hypothetical protein [Deinococcus metalli]GHF48170.1 hypothetical protein GCM10017781_25680 [Deinococcus metalli]
MTELPEPTPTPPTAASAAPVDAPAPAAAARPARRRRVRTPAERRHRGQFLHFLRIFGGVMTLFALAYYMWTPGEWPNELLVWVLLTILADEFGGWFGYAGLLLGGLGYFSPEPPPAQWLVILPLIGGVLFAALLIKHSGGPFVLPFAALLYAGVLFVVGRYGLKVDPQLNLPANETFQRTALLAMGVGLGFSFVRQLIGIIARAVARRQARMDAASVPA